MKHIYFLLITLFLHLSFSNAQNEPWGACGMDHRSAKNKHATFQDGSEVLGETYNNTACGLNYVQASQVLGQRFHLAFSSSCEPFNGVSQPATLAISGIPSCNSILQAYLWCSTSGDGVAITATLKNPAGTSTNFPMTIIGSGPDKCWGAYGSYTYRADVTSAITGNGNYSISNLPTSKTVSLTTNDVDGVTLFIIYQDLNATYSATLVIDDGCYESGSSSEVGYATDNITGFTACSNSTSATAIMIVSDMQCTPYGPNLLTLNGACCYAVSEDWWNFVTLSTTVTAGQTSAFFAVDASLSYDCWDFLMDGIYYQNTNCTVCAPTLSIATGFTATSCASKTGTATANPSGGTGSYTYSWNSSPVQTSQTATGLGAGSYTVTVTDGNGCSGTESVTVPSSTITASASPDTAVCASGSVQLEASPTGGDTYSWAPNTNLSSTTIANPIATPSVTTTYTVTVTSAGGCTSTATATVSVNTTPPAPTVTKSVTGDTLFASTNASYTGYQWYRDSVIMSGQTSDTLVIGSDSSYFSVVVTGTDGCTNLGEFDNRDLPIELIDFDAIYDPARGAVDLYWSTASEINNDFFTVEKTKDDINFTTVAKIKGAGTSYSLLNYYTEDNNPYIGISYYRLKQTDFDGKFVYSNLVATLVRSTSQLQIISLSNNAAQNSMQYFVSSPTGTPFTIVVTDLIGKIMITQTTTENVGTLDFSSFAHGLYFFKVFNGSGSSVRKFVY